jgi:hypothetical protein
LAVVKRWAIGLTFAFALVFALVACGNETHPEYHPETALSYSQTISEPVTVFNEGSQSKPAYTNATYAPGARDPSKVLVLETHHLEHPAEVVGVIDAHEEMGKHESALWLLKTKAAALGADAVIGVEFHHGEGEGEPTHLSGLAVRFIRSVPYPVD